jgi:hypothetical protein
MIDGDDYGAVGGMNEWQGKQQYSEKTCPAAVLFTTKLTLPHTGLNLGLRDGKPATDRLSHDRTSILKVASLKKQ